MLESSYILWRPVGTIVSETLRCGSLELGTIRPDTLFCDFGEEFFQFFLHFQQNFSPMAWSSLTGTSREIWNSSVLVLLNCSAHVLAS